jgi:hypothetical protein
MPGGKVVIIWVDGMPWCGRGRRVEMVLTIKGKKLIEYFERLVKREQARLNTAQHMLHWAKTYSSLVKGEPAMNQALAQKAARTLLEALEADIRPRIEPDGKCFVYYPRVRHRAPVRCETLDDAVAAWKRGEVR